MSSLRLVSHYHLSWLPCVSGMGEAAAIYHASVLPRRPGAVPSGAAPACTSVSRAIYLRTWRLPLTAVVLRLLRLDVADPWSFYCRSLPTARMDRSVVRMLPRRKRLHLPRPRQRPRVPDRPRLRVGRPGPGKRRHARLHGLPQLLRQRRYARPQRHRPGTARRRRPEPPPQEPPYLVARQR